MLRSRLRLAALAVGLVFSAGAQAQGIGLKPPPSQDARQKGRDALLPVFITADRLESISDQVTRAVGNAELSKGVTSISADRLNYSKETDEVEALGNVRLVKEGDVMSGPSLRYRIDGGTGVFDQPNYSLAPRKRPDQQPMEAHGQARLLELLGQDKYRMTEATFTTCKPGEEDWILRVGELDLDYGRQVGTAHSAFLYFKDVPILGSPWLNFSLNNARKSGFLPPSFAVTGKGGGEVTLPFYWNIAPNHDATLTPRLISKRGVELRTEFRYLEPTYRGETRYEILPQDRAADRTRYGLASLHTFSDPSWGISGGWDINKVSDDFYFRDLSTTLASTSQTNLLRDAYVTKGFTFWGTGGIGLTARVQRYQTLQTDPVNPVAIPYDRLPQLTLGASRLDIHGLDFTASGEYVDFAHPTQVIGRRTTAYPSLSLPLITPSFYLTPKLGYNITHYELLRNDPGTPSTINRSLPIFSLDSGMTFERNTSFGGRDMLQTLEPRLYYVRIPFRDQNAIPLFDTGLADFNYAQIFSENSFSGNDRINDADQLTAALTSRLLLANGQELMRGTFGQRFYFKSQQVTLNPTDEPRTYAYSDYLAAFSGRVAPRWTADTAAEYNPRLGRAERYSVGTRYQPEVQKVINLGYRYNRDTLHQVDASTQWPLGGGWYGVGRYNFSLKDGRLIESLAGFEYNGGCWVARVVVQRFAVSAGTSTNSIFLQLELSGFSRIGSNPLEALKRNIPGYTRLNQPPDPNRPFNFYE